LARKTFHALKPFINLEQCGRWFPGRYQEQPHPIFMITQEQWELLRQCRPGAGRLHYKDGSPFYVWHLYAGRLSPKHVQAMLDGEDKFYYTGSPFGLALAMIDGDAHEEWQDDLDDLQRDVCRALGKENLFLVPSSRGFNAHVKIDYSGHSVDEYNEALARLQRLLKQQTAHRKCCVEVKGKAGDRSHYGTLAKLPCYGPWSFERLAEFERLPVKPFSWLLGVISALEEKQAPKAPEVKQAAPKKKRGSGLGFKIPAEELARLPEAVEFHRSRSYYAYAMREGPRRRDVKMTALDFAAGLAVADLCSKYVNSEDMDMPSRFISLVWAEAYAQGLVSRAFNNSRWSAVWKTLVDCGFLDVRDETYWYDPTGREKGQCMKWALRPECSFFLRQDNEKKEERRLLRQVISVMTPRPLPCPRSCAAATARRASPAPIPRSGRRKRTPSWRKS
jgi:hypothetical protein